MNVLEITCRACGGTKPVDQFNRNKTYTLGYDTKCRSCKAEYGRQRRAANPEEHRRKQREAYLRAKEQPEITHEHLVHRLRYDAETGRFFWRNPNPNNRQAKPGAEANGSPMAGGYWRIGIDGRQYYTHRLAWMYVNGAWPTSELVHIDGDLSNNAIANLRLSERFHGLSGSKIHTIWKSMIQRCYDEGSTSYPHYGGRGIKVCDRWRNSVEAFLEDMGEPPPGRSVDRMDNDGDYEPGNCRWATAQEQSANRRNNIRVRFGGEVVTLAEAARLAGVDYKSLHHRYRNGVRGAELFRGARRA